MWGGAKNLYQSVMLSLTCSGTCVVSSYIDSWERNFAASSFDKAAPKPMGHAGTLLAHNAALTLIYCCCEGITWQTASILPAGDKEALKRRCHRYVAWWTLKIMFPKGKLSGMLSICQMGILSLFESWHKNKLGWYIILEKHLQKAGGTGKLLYRMVSFQGYTKYQPRSVLSAITEQLLFGHVTFLSQPTSSGLSQPWKIKMNICITGWLVCLCRWQGPLFPNFD